MKEMVYYCPCREKIMIWTNKINGHTMPFWFFEQENCFDVWSDKNNLIELGEL